MRKRKIDYKRRQQIADAIVAPDRPRCVLLHGNCRSVLVADSDVELIKLRAFVWRMHMERRINRSESPRDPYLRS